MKGRRKEKARIQAALDHWAATLELTPWWKIDLHWSDFQAGDETESTQADTSADWHLRCASLTFYLEQTVILSDADLDMVVVHELSHLLLAPVDPKEKERIPLLELATESVARAILAVAGKAKS